MISTELKELVQKQKFKVKIRCGKRRCNATFELKKNKFYVYSEYAAKDTIKENFEGRRWDPDRRAWYFPATQHNLFQMESIIYGVPDPYARWTNFTDYTSSISSFCEERQLTPYEHQVQMVNMGLNGRSFLWAAEMGTGKTLAAIILMEMVKVKTLWWVGPKSALVSAKADFTKWKSPLKPLFMTYQGLVKVVETWKKGEPAPDGLVLDESSRCKNPEAQRSRAAKHVTDAMRLEHDIHYIAELSGSPAPKTPADWWMQCEIAQPGFLREGSIYTFRERVGHIVQVETTPGAGAFNKLKTWKDSEDKCKVCGDTREEHRPGHTFEPGVNEVKKLSGRMDGLVKVWLKEDCLDLPDKRYELYEIEPSRDILNIADTIVNTAKRPTDALVKLRTLSDGFLYEDYQTGEMRKCEPCKGQGEVEDIDEMVTCFTCKGTGVQPVIKRRMVPMPSPKLELLSDLLTMHEECGRFVVYAGFQGSIDRIQEHVLSKGWNVIKADGRGWAYIHATAGVTTMSDVDMIREFQEGATERICFVGQPGAAGMGLTLTASPSVFFYSNDFSPENRMQAEDRVHRIGMSANGGVVIDAAYLPSDYKIIKSLRDSKKLQFITMDDLRSFLNAA